MNCRQVSRLVSAYMDGELTGTEMLQIRRHLDGCRACTLQYESLRYTKHLVARLSYAEPRAGFAERICARLDSIEVPGYQRVWNRLAAYGHKHLTPLAAGFLALGGILVLLAAGSVKGPEVTIAQTPSFYPTGSLRYPPAEVVTTPAAFLTPGPTPPRPLIPEPAPDEANGSRIFTLAGLEGH